MAKKPTRYTVTDGKMVLILEVAEEGGFTVTAPFIQGLVTEADTLEQAFKMAHDAAATIKAGLTKLTQSKRKRALRRSAR